MCVKYILNIKILRYVINFIFIQTSSKDLEMNTHLLLRFADLREMNRRRDSDKGKWGNFFISI